MRRHQPRRTSRRIANLRSKRIKRLVSGRKYSIVLNRGIKGRVRYRFAGERHQLPTRVSLDAENGGLHEQNLTAEGNFEFRTVASPQMLHLQLLGAPEGLGEQPVRGRVRLRIGGKLVDAPLRLTLHHRAGAPVETAAGDDGRFALPGVRGAYSLRLALPEAKG